VTHETAGVFGDNMNIDPALTVDQLRSSNVVDVLLAVGRVMLTVVVEPDHRLVIAHVEECFTAPVADPDLCSGRR